MKAYVLNQTHRTDRKENMLEDFKDAPFTLEFTEGIQYSNPFQNRVEDKYDAVAMTHLELLKKARAEGLKTLLLLEDDCTPDQNYIKRWSEIKEYLDNNLDLWDTFNGGQLGILDVKKVIKLNKDNLILQAYGGSNSHWMYFNVESVLPKLLESFGLEKRLEIDMFYPLKCKNYACFPFLGEQSPGFSDINNINRDWTVLYAETKRQMKRNLRELMRD
jgi:hypothetical protein